MDLTFHIIFCPGHVRYLKLGVLSLLRHSDYRYRLVGNGLEQREREELARLCRTSRRLEFLPYPGKKMLPHGVLLSALQAREASNHFCFMDPDIFASASFQEPLEANLAECDVFSSCSPLCRDPAERHPGFAGHCLRAPNGLPLASTYLAVYRQEPLRRVITETGVGFEDYRAEEFTDSIEQQLQALGLTDVAWTDTGKLLNVLSHGSGVRFRHAELDGLSHIGGITSALQKPGWLKERQATWLQRPYVLREEDIDPEASLRSRLLFAVNEAGRGHFGDFSARVEKRRLRLTRCRIAYFFAFFLKSLVEGTPEPQLRISDTRFSARIRQVCNSIRQAYQSIGSVRTEAA